MKKIVLAGLVMCGVMFVSGCEYTYPKDQTVQTKEKYCSDGKVVKFDFEGTTFVVWFYEGYHEATSVLLDKYKTEGK